MLQASLLYKSANCYYCALHRNEQSTRRTRKTICIRKRDRVKESVSATWWRLGSKGCCIVTLVSLPMDIVDVAYVWDVIWVLGRFELKSLHRLVSCCPCLGIYFSRHCILTDTRYKSIKFSNVENAFIAIDTINDSVFMCSLLYCVDFFFSSSNLCTCTMSARMVSSCAVWIRDLGSWHIILKLRWIMQLNQNASKVQWLYLLSISYIYGFSLNQQMVHIVLYL